MEMIIGHANSRSVFGKKSGMKMGFDYLPIKRAWMTRKLFFSSLLTFNSFIRCKSGRKILLLLENSPAHEYTSDLPHLHFFAHIFYL